MKPPPGLAHLLLGQPELAETLMRGLALKGTLPQYLSPELEPSVTIADLTQPEYLYLRRILRLSQNIFLPAVAAQFSQAAFAPTAGAARSLAVVEQLILTNFTAGAVAFQVDFQPNIVVGAAAGVPKSGLDDRSIPFNQLQPTPSFGWVGATAAASIVGTGALTIAVPANTTVFFPVNAVFTARAVLSTPAPSLLLVALSAVNTACNIGAIWRERPLLATEAA